MDMVIPEIYTLLTKTYETMYIKFHAAISRLFHFILLPITGDYFSVTILIKVIHRNIDRYA
jgi:hypothetical protein